jgi:hypothetical protein
LCLTRLLGVFLACDAGVPRRRGGTSGSGRLPLPRVLIGRERGIGTGRGLWTSCVEVTKKSH